MAIVKVGSVGFDTELIYGVTHVETGENSQPTGTIYIRGQEKIVVTGNEAKAVEEILNALPSLTEYLASLRLRVVQGWAGIADKAEADSTEKGN